MKARKKFSFSLFDFGKNMIAVMKESHSCIRKESKGIC